MREYSIGTSIDLEPTLTPAQTQQLIAAGTQRNVAKSGVIFHQGAPATSVLVLLSGEAKATQTNANGDVALLRLHLPGSIMGLTALASQRRRDAQVVATMPVRLAEIDRDAFVAALTAHPDLAVDILRGMADRMSDFHHRVGHLLTQRVEQRLASALLSLSRPDPGASGASASQDIRLTHEDLANLLGARRPTISAAISQLEARGLIARTGRSLSVRDRPGLAALADWCERSSG